MAWQTRPSAPVSTQAAYGDETASGMMAAQTSVDDYVNGSRIDRRIHAGNWCNQSCRTSRPARGR
jgi:cellulase/cellobiase CelA1